MKSGCSTYTRRLIAALAVSVLAACGVETATTATSGALVKKQEAEQAKKTQEQVRGRIEQTMDQAQERSRQAGGSDAR
jgi:hypothetical protein